MKMIHLPKTTKSKIKKAKEDLVDKMIAEGVTPAAWEEMQKMYKGYCEMLLKRAAAIDPNTVLIVSVGLAEVLILAIANGGFDIKQAWNSRVRARV